MRKNISHVQLNSFIPLLFTFLSFSVQAQSKELRQLLNQTVTIDAEHIKIRAHILAEHHEFKVKEDLMYYWFLSGNIQHTRGGYSGKILEGEYTEFYPGDKLKTKGEFYLGLKNGTWTTWNEEGEHLSVVSWKKGVQHGSFKTYSSTGKLIQTGESKNGLLHGKIISYEENEIINITYFKEGKEVIEKGEIEDIEKEVTESEKKAKKKRKKKEKKEAKEE